MTLVTLVKNSFSDVSRIRRQLEQLEVKRNEKEEKV